MPQQQQLMTACPVDGSLKPYPSHAAQWRAYHGRKAWLFNPWTGKPRDSDDIGSDPFGLLIIPPREAVYAASSANGD